MKDSDGKKKKNKKREDAWPERYERDESSERKNKVQGRMPHC
jgi:hypothetical protein